MGISEENCKEKGGKIYDLADTNRKVCVLPEKKEEEQEEEKKVYLLD